MGTCHIRTYDDALGEGVEKLVREALTHTRVTGISQQLRVFPLRAVSCVQKFARNLWLVDLVKRGVGLAGKEEGTQHTCIMLTDR